MKFYKIIVSYDGTDYQGWQEQKDVPTIAGKLKKTFIKAFEHDVSIVGASRTDAGVHALGQVARIRTNLELNASKLMKVWNNGLPQNILIRSCQEVDQIFHPMKNVLQKTYFYHFFLERPLPFNSRYGWYFRWDVDLEKLSKCLKVFEGTHDFRSFSTGYEMESTIRTIDKIELKYTSDLGYRIEVKGKSFLHHMIRRVVGASLEVASRPKLKIEYLKECLEERDSEQILPNADAKGLMLYNIEYSND
jgi:tRNA pseudouridine38-40 synthase